jgi:thiol-disulfide isomerase/thioredoxin
MRSFHLTFCLLSAVLIFSGCSQTGALRSSNTSDVKTIASVGDKPLPIVSGEPGASLRAETEDVDRPVRSGSRISGRVYDERGKPLQGVKVRLAVGGTAGGKAVVATTDRSGAFTLSGLRSGSAYTVIAEYDDEEGTMSGRAQVKAPQTDVRIALQAQGGSNQGHASIRPARPRIEPISNVDSSDEDSFNESDGRSGTQINSEDLEPPAAEATALLPERDTRSRRSSAGNSQSSGRAGWNVRQGGSKAGTGSGSDSGSASRAHDDENSEPANPPGSANQNNADAEDDGPNPLPPAIESGASNSVGRPRALVEEHLVRTAQTESDNPSQPPRRAVRAVSKREDLQPATRDAQPADQAPQPIPKELVEADGDGSDPDSSARTARRPTWGEITGKQANVPLDESVRRAKSDGPRGDQGVVTLTSTNPPAKSGLARLLGSPPAALDEAVKQSACSIDAGERRLIDFKLPDLNGKLVSLQDIDADVILLDFWGSWCQPCRKSIAHLIELQQKYAGKRFTVIGIACEKAAAPRDRQASAVKAASELGITYPVLLSGRDGTCPVQQALQIQFFPTMVLITRDGKLLAREHGATDITLPRMDRAIASALQGQGRGAGN